MAEQVAYRTITESLRRLGGPVHSIGAVTLDSPNRYGAPDDYSTIYPTIIPSSSSSASTWGIGERVPVVIHVAVADGGLMQRAEAIKSVPDAFATDISLVPGAWISNLLNIQWKTLLQPSGHWGMTHHLSSFREGRWSGAFTCLGDTWLIAAPSIAEDILFLAASSKLAYAKVLAQRILQIEEILREDDDDPLTLAESSVRSLIEFLEANPDIGRPQLAPSRSGYLMAKWSAPEHKKVTVHFYADGGAEVYLFAPNPKHPDKQDLDTSHTTVDALRGKLAAIGALAWMN